MNAPRHGRATAPALPATLGEDVRTIETTAFVPGRMAMPITINRQVLDLAVDADYDPNRHEPSAAHRAALERADLAGDALHEDPYAETDRLKMRPAPGEVAAFRAYVYDQRFRENIQRFSTESPAVADRLDRLRAACETTADGANVRLAMRAAAGGAGLSVVDRLTASAALSVDAAARDRLLPPATPADTDRIAIANMQTLGANDLKRLLAIDFLPDLGVADRNTFLTMPCANTIVRRVWPLFMAPEAQRRHFNVVEIVGAMVAAGCKYHSVARAESRERLGAVLDERHYAGDIDPATRTLRGGHEHYDARNRRTRLVVFHFYCVLRPKQTKEQQQRSMAERAVGIAAQAEREEAGTARFDPDDDMWDTAGLEQDDDYTGGNDLQNPGTHFIYRVTLTCVEAVDCVCANEALEPRPAPPATARRATHVRLDGSETSIDAQTNAAPVDSGTQSTPDGLGALSLESATVLVGKYRAATFLANCQGALPFYPLCVRAMQFSAGTERC